MIIEKDEKGAFKPIPTIITFMKTDDKLDFDQKWNEAKVHLGE